MVSRSNRPRAPGQATSARPVTGDLFAHYGVDERESVSAELPAPRQARACPGCGWYVALPAEPACPQCGTTVGPKP